MCNVRLSVRTLLRCYYYFEYNTAPLPDLPAQIDMDVPLIASTRNCNRSGSPVVQFVIVQLADRTRRLENRFTVSRRSLADGVRARAYVSRCDVIQQQAEQDLLADVRRFWSSIVAETDACSAPMQQQQPPSQRLRRPDAQVVGWSSSE